MPFFFIYFFFYVFSVSVRRRRRGVGTGQQPRRAWKERLYGRRGFWGRSYKLAHGGSLDDLFVCWVNKTRAVKPLRHFHSWRLSFTQDGPASQWDWTIGLDWSGVIPKLYTAGARVLTIRMSPTKDVLQSTNWYHRPPHVPSHLPHVRCYRVLCVEHIQCSLCANSIKTQTWACSFNLKRS